jgi:hypothetical protein
VRAAPELLGAPTIRGGSALPGVGGGGSHRSQISLPSRPECTKRRKNSQFSAIIDFKNTENSVFYLKILLKIYSQEVFVEYINY